MRILITGACGFAACHLAEVWQETGAELFGLVRRENWLPGFTHLANVLQLRYADLLHAEQLEPLLRDIEPDVICHLAAYSDAGRSFQEPEAAWAGNLLATRNLYDAVLRWGGKPRILFVSSGAVYGDARTPGTMFTEESELRPNNPYAVSKAAADLLSYQYYRTHGLHIVRARPFNHVGPGQTTRFALAHWASQIAAIERGEKPPVLHVGNLAPERDFADVRDVVRAYRLLVSYGLPGEAYNVATGRWLPMRDFLEELLALCTIPIKTATDPNLIRKVETATVRVSVERLRHATEWQPQCDLRQTMRDLLDYYRRHPEPERQGKAA
jgi:GDP-4-dehydro-6-deoxy-D-mannose reductase